LPGRSPRAGSDDALAASHAIAAIDEGTIASGPAVDHVVAAVARLDQIGPEAAVDLIAARSAAEDVVAGAAVQAVVTGAAADAV
jgi:hypothetical protein